jgi:3-phosphoshikimate 1-carboxyvinyltransferase
MKKTITKINHSVNAIVTVPGSKSITNRALLLAAMAEGTSILHGMLFSDDSEALLIALDACGIEMQVDRGSNVCSITGCSGVLPNKTADIYCRDAGTISEQWPFLSA